VTEAFSHLYEKAEYMLQLPIISSTEDRFWRLQADIIDCCNEAKKAIKSIVNSSKDEEANTFYREEVNAISELYSSISEEIHIVGSQ